MANLKISLRKKGASSFEGGDKLLPETDWAYILNKPPTFVPDPHEHSIEEITGLRGELDGQITQAWVTANTRSKTWVPLWSEVTGLVDQLDGKASAMHTHIWDSIQSKPTFAPVATSGRYEDLANLPSIPTIPSVMNTAEGNSGTATTRRTINAANLKSIILNHSPAGSRPASDVKAWAKADNKPSYTWSEIGSKPSVIIEGDARLTDNRPASDVYSWAKAVNRPSYNLSQIEETEIYKRVTENEKNQWTFKADITDIEDLIGQYDADITPIINGKLSSSLKGSANGLAELDANGKVPSTQLPSFVDDVLEYTKLSSFPTTGESGKIYIDLTTNKTYRWGGSDYVVISETLALGTTSSTAYRGDLGKIAYDHSQVAHAPSNAQKNSDITTAEITAKLTGTITTHTHNASAIVEDASHRFVTDSQKTAWNNKENAITKGTTAQYFRGDMSLATFPTIPTIPSLMTQADITASTSTQRTINASVLNANFYNKASLDLLFSGKQNSLGFTPVPNTRTIAGLNLTADRSRDDLLGVSANGFFRRTGTNTYDVRTNAQVKSDIGLGSVPNIDATNPANITQSASYRFVTDSDKTSWNGKQGALSIMQVQEGINGSLTTARSINAANLRGIIEDYIENAPYESLPLGTSRTSSFTFVIGDANRFIRCSGGAINATVPPNSSVAFPIGTEIYLYRESTGAVTIAAGSGVTLQSVDNKKAISKQYQTITIKKLAVNTWTIVGAL